LSSWETSTRLQQEFSAFVVIGVGNTTSIGQLPAIAITSKTRAT
jgi:hypothetical protein